MSELPFHSQIRSAVARHEPIRREEVYGSGPPVDLVSEEILQFVMTEASGRCLDLGCGVGPYLTRLINQGLPAVGVEYSHNIARLATHLGRPVVNASATQLPFADDEFDTVVMIEALEHIPDIHQALREVVRVTKRRLVMTVPNFAAVPQLSRLQLVPWHMLEASHVNFFTPEILMAVLQPYFKNVVVRNLGHFFTVDEEPVYMHCAAVADLV